MSRKAFGNHLALNAAAIFAKMVISVATMATSYQNYQCTNPNCRHQFHPDMPRARKKNLLSIALYVVDLWSSTRSEPLILASVAPAGIIIFPLPT
ncbi:Uncharacterized [Moorella glycerini]|uniref:Uncharacterized protein n=1 Tax=Neomoorella stamsii TaxID=1266720 RepID=A0A9X7J5N3_9FIRM|nr:hypothetical protein MOST_03170 [Moorella stamsii]CEP66853.1 Uncharacterized [Moorella glycerini]